MCFVRKAGFTEWNSPILSDVAENKILKIALLLQVFKLLSKATIYVILQLTIILDIQWLKFWLLFAWRSNVEHNVLVWLLQVEMVRGLMRVDDDKRSSLMCKLEWTQL